MIGFYVLAIALVGTAVFTVTQKSPVYSVVGLLGNFMVLAMLYFTLNAEFLGIVQIVVYSGAILMLFVFVIALLSSGVGPFSEGPNRLPRIGVPAMVATLVAFGFLAFGALHRPLVVTPQARTTTSTSILGPAGTADVFGSVADFGKALFTVQLLPFEVTAFILMVAVVGVVLLAGDVAPAPTHGRHLPRKKAREREPILKARR